VRYRHLKRTVIAVLAAVAFVLTLGLLVRLVLKSDTVHDATLRWMEDVAASRGFDLEVADLQWEVLPPRVVMHDVTVIGPGIGAAIDRLEADVARIRVARRTLELGTVAAGGVTVRLEDVPRTPSRSGKSLVRVAIRHLDVKDVTFEGRNLPGHLDVLLDGLDIAWTKEREIPSGFIRIKRAQVTPPGMETIDVGLEARLIVERGLHLPSWRIHGEGLHLEGSGEISGGTARVDLEGQLDLDELDRVIRGHGVLSGNAEVAAKIDTGSDQLIQAEVRSSALVAAQFPVENLLAHLVLEPDAVHGVVDRARFHGGTLTGTYRLGHLRGPTRPHRVVASAEGVEVGGLLDNLNVPTGGLSARMDVDVELEWNGRAFDRGRGSGVAFFQPDAKGLPLDGRLDIELSPEGLLKFSAEDLMMGSSVVDWEGPLTLGSWQPAWSVRASPADLGEVVSVVNGFIGSEVLPPWIDGTGNLQVTLNGPWDRLVVGARIDARPLLLPPIVLDQLVTEATISDSQVRLGPTRFRIAEGHGEVEGSMAWGETDVQDQLDLAIRGFRIPIASVAQWLGVDGQAEGVVSFTGGLRGPLSDPRGSWAVGFDDVDIMGQDLGDGTATVALADDRFEGRGLSFSNGLGGSAWWDVPAGMTGGQLKWTSMPLNRFGDTAISLLGDEADVEADFRIPKDGPVTGHVTTRSEHALINVESTAEAIDVDMEVAEAFTVTSRMLRSEDGTLEGDGELHLGSAHNLVTNLAPATAIPLSGTGHAGFQVRWPQHQPPIMTGALDELDLQLDGRQIRLLAPSSFTLSPDLMELEGLHVAIREDEFFARGSVRSDGAIEANLAGTLDGLLLRFVLPDWEPAGQATGVVELLGTLDSPRFEGVADVHGASFRFPDTQTIISDIDGTVLLSANDTVLEGVDFRFMQGQGRTSGRIGWQEGTIDIALNGTAKGLRYTVLPDLVAHLSGSWRLVGPTDDLELSGDLTVDDASLRSKEDIASLLLRWFGDGNARPEGSGGMRLDLKVSADETIQLRNPSLRLTGSASLDISGTSNKPGLVGKVEFLEGGEVTLQTLRYEVERASLTFSDPEVVDPFIDVQARTWVQNYDVALRVTGTRDRLVPSVSSNPPLTEDQIYGLMAVGRRTETVGGTGAMGVGFASTILSGQLASEFDRRAGFSLPVDQVRVDPFAETDTGETGGARVTLVKQLGPSWTVTVQSNLSGARAPVIVSRWYLAPGIFVEASQDIEGSYGIDLFMRRTY
jgi:hypothetical protein